MITTDARRPISDSVPERYLFANRRDLSTGIQAAIEDSGVLRGIAFHGLTGRGKSHAMAAIANECGSRYWIDWAEFCADVRRHWTYHTPDAHWFDPTRWAIAVPHLFVDDLGEERDEKGPDFFASLIKGRSDGGRPLNLTTNLTPAEISSRYGARTLSRLHEMCEFIELTGVDRRLVKA